MSSAFSPVDLPPVTCRKWSGYVIPMLHRISRSLVVPKSSIDTASSVSDF